MPGHDAAQLVLAVAALPAETAAWEEEQVTALRRMTAAQEGDRTAELYQLLGIITASEAAAAAREGGEGGPNCSTPA